MCYVRCMDDKPTQSDDDEAHFDEQLKKLIKHKPVEKPETEA